MLSHKKNTLLNKLLQLELYFNNSLYNSNFDSKVIDTINRNITSIKKNIKRL